MPEAVTTLLETVLARVRDQQGTFGGDNRSVAKTLLSRLQGLYNNQLQLVLTDISVIVTPFLMFYPFYDTLADVISISTVSYQGRELDRMTLRQLKAIDPNWHRATASRPEGFMQLGLSYLLVWPALLVQDTVDVSATIFTDFAAAPEENLNLTISSQQTPRLLQFLELLLLHRQRDMLSFEALYTQIKGERQGGT